MRKVRLGLLGASQIAAKVLPSVRKVQGIEVVGIAARDSERAQKFAHENQIPKYFSTYEECITSNLIDCVYISTLNISHFDLIILSLKNGKHVLCEKPLVLRAKEAELAFDLARANGVILLEGLMYRFHPQVQRVLALSKNIIGVPKHIQLNFAFKLYDENDFQTRARATRKGGGGALNDLGCYCIDYLNLLMNFEEPTWCQSTMKIENGIDVQTEASFKYMGGTTASIYLSIIHPGLNLWEVSGPDFSHAALRFDPQGKGGVPLYLVNSESETTLEVCESIDLFEKEFRNFAMAIQDLEIPYIPPKESIANVKLMEKIRNLQR